MGVIKITKFGTPPAELEKFIDFKFITVKEGLKKLGEETQNYMRGAIKQGVRRQGSTGRLSNSITVEVNDTGKDYSVGVGVIEFMNSFAPYWFLINYGGLSGVAKQGKRVPGYFGNYNPPISQYKGSWLGHEQFFYTPDEASSDRGQTFFMKPESPIMPMNYIDRTMAWVNTVVKVHFYNWTKTTNVSVNTLSGIKKI